MELHCEFAPENTFSSVYVYVYLRLNILKQTLTSLLQTAFDVERPCSWSLVRLSACHRSYCTCNISFWFLYMLLTFFISFVKRFYVIIYKVGTRPRKSEEEKQLVQERRKRGGNLCNSKTEFTATEEIPERNKATRFQNQSGRKSWCCD